MRNSKKLSYCIAKKEEVKENRINAKQEYKYIKIQKMLKAIYKENE